MLYLIIPCEVFINYYTKEFNFIYVFYFLTIKGAGGGGGGGGGGLHQNSLEIDFIVVSGRRE